MNEWLPILYPRFYTSTDLDGYEHVILVNNNYRLSDSFEAPDKTQFESTVNHVHLLDKFSIKYISLMLDVGESIGKNLSRALVSSYPDRAFVVYVQISPAEGMMIRFHQIWENEPRYFELYEDTPTLLTFRTDIVNQ